MLLTCFIGLEFGSRPVSLPGLRHGSPDHSAWIQSYAFGNMRWNSHGVCDNWHTFVFCRELPAKALGVNSCRLLWFYVSSKSLNTSLCSNTAPRILQSSVLNCSSTTLSTLVQLHLRHWAVWITINPQQFVWCATRRLAQQSTLYSLSCWFVLFIPSFPQRALYYVIPVHYFSIRSQRTGSCFAESTRPSRSPSSATKRWSKSMTRRYAIPAVRPRCPPTQMPPIRFLASRATPSLSIPWRSKTKIHSSGNSLSLPKSRAANADCCWVDCRIRLEKTAKPTSDEVLVKTNHFFVWSTGVMNPKTKEIIFVCLFVPNSQQDNLHVWC